MDGRTDGQMIRRTDRAMENKWRDRWMDEQMDRRTERHEDRQTNGGMDEQTDRQTNTQRDRQIDIQNQTKAQLQEVTVRSSQHNRPSFSACRLLTVLSSSVCLCAAVLISARRVDRFSVSVVSSISCRTLDSS